jgi:hypothetical protein
MGGIIESPINLLDTRDSIPYPQPNHKRLLINSVKGR